MKPDVLSSRALNRATLERQLLLRREMMPAVDAVTHLVGLQAQLPLNPYLGLWSRLDGFMPAELSELLIDRTVVRTVVMRSTIHLVTADDCLMLRPLMQPVLEAELRRHRDFGPVLQGVDLNPVLAFAKRLLAKGPLSGTELRVALAARFPSLDAAALAFACRNRLAFVQVPPRRVWGRSAQVTNTTAEAWLGRPLARKPSIDEAVLRYIRAFGPATVADVAAWCRLTGMREVVERLRPRLRPFRDERGSELFDLPDAPRPDPDTPAPPRFLPEYDNALLSHADRSRFVSDEIRRRLTLGASPERGSLLSDGSVVGTWRAIRNAGVALEINLVRRLGRGATDAVASEGRKLLRLIAPEPGSRDVSFNVLD